MIFPIESCHLLAHSLQVLHQCKYIRVSDLSQEINQYSASSTRHIKPHRNIVNVNSGKTEPSSVHQASNV